MSNWIPLDQWRQLPAKVSGIYALRNRANGKEYIGQAACIRKRMYYHERARDKGTAIHEAIKKYGAASFDVCILAEGSTETLDGLEVQLIQERGSYARQGGYNLTLGGGGFRGRVFTDEQRKANGDRKRGHVKSVETLALMRASSLMAAADRRGVPRSEDTKAKISLRMAGKVRPPRGTMPTNQRDAIGKANKGRLAGARNPKARLVGVWLPDSLVPLAFDTARLAAAYLGVKSKSLSCWCRGKYQCPHPYQVAYL